MGMGESKPYVIDDFDSIDDVDDYDTIISNWKNYDFAGEDDEIPDCDLNLPDKCLHRHGTLLKVHDLSRDSKSEDLQKLLKNSENDGSGNIACCLVDSNISADLSSSTARNESKSPKSSEVSVETSSCSSKLQRTSKKSDFIPPGSQQPKPDSQQPKPDLCLLTSQQLKPDFRLPVSQQLKSDLNPPTSLQLKPANSKGLKVCWQQTLKHKECHNGTLETNMDKVVTEAPVLPSDIPRSITPVWKPVDSSEDYMNVQANRAKSSSSQYSSTHIISTKIPRLFGLRHLTRSISPKNTEQHEHGASFSQESSESPTCKPRLGQLVANSRNSLNASLGIASFRYNKESSEKSIRYSFTDMQYKQMENNTAVRVVQRSALIEQSRIPRKRLGMNSVRTGKLSPQNLMSPISEKKSEQDPSILSVARPMEMSSVSTNVSGVEPSEGHSGVKDNERVGALASNAAIENVSSMSKSDIINALRENIHSEDFNEDKRYCIGRSPYQTSSGIASVVACWNFLFSTMGNGSLQPLAEETALRLLGFDSFLCGNIDFDKAADNITLLRWFHQLNTHFNVNGRCYFTYKPVGKNKTQEVTEETALNMLKIGLTDQNTFFIYRCYKHYLCPIGYEETPELNTDADKNDSGDKVCTWVLIADTSRQCSSIQCVNWDQICLDLNCRRPNYYDIRQNWKGIMKLDKINNEADSNYHCIMTFQKVTEQVQVSPTVVYSSTSDSPTPFPGSQSPMLNSLVPVSTQTDKLQPLVDTVKSELGNSSNTSREDVVDKQLFQDQLKAHNSSLSLKRMFSKNMADVALRCLGICLC